MGCKTNSFSDECDDNHCNKSVPALFGVSGAGGVTFRYEEYPQATIRSDGRYNLPDRKLMLLCTHITKLSMTLD